MPGGLPPAHQAFPAQLADFRQRLEALEIQARQAVLPWTNITSFATNIRATTGGGRWGLLGGRVEDATIRLRGQAEVHGGTFALGSLFTLPAELQPANEQELAVTVYIPGSGYAVGQLNIRTAVLGPVGAVVLFHEAEGSVLPNPLAEGAIVIFDDKTYPAN
jgi:hypothetical protein